MIAGSDEGGAADLTAHPDAEDGYGLVGKANQRGHRDRPEHLHRPRIEEPLDGLVASDVGAEEYDQHHYYPRQGLEAPIAEREASTRPQTGQSESDPQRHGGRRVPEVVDGVREKDDATRDQDHDYLQERRGEEPDEGPLDGLDALLGGSYGGVHSPVSVSVMPAVIVVIIATRLISSEVSYHSG